MIASSFFEQDALACARELIGCELIRGETKGLVIETEAYHEHGDEACHLFTRPSARVFAENNPPGTAYVYLNYGIHWLTNVLCIDERTGARGFVLIRALEPTGGIEVMQQRRGQSKTRDLCSGPGKLSAALGIGPDHHGQSMTHSKHFCFAAKKALSIITDRRVGISKAVELPWRFLARDHEGVSVKAGKA
ncbi:MAG: DNA-3-methyladenine glycosylase [Verrucomicrobiota bacterium]